MVMKTKNLHTKGTAEIPLRRAKTYPFPDNIILVVGLQAERFEVKIVPDAGRSWGTEGVCVSQKINKVVCHRNRGEVLNFRFRA
jgi:hypothetical protein